MRCEGHNWEEIRRHADLTIRVHGYLIQQVTITDTLESLHVELVPVHETHLATGLVAAWEDHQTRRAAAGDFLQVHLGSAWHCHHHDGTERRLDQPA